LSGGRSRKFVGECRGEPRRGGYEQREAEPVAVEDDHVEGRGLHERRSGEQEPAGRDLERVTAASRYDEAKGNESPKDEDEDLAALEGELHR
jgi:hypothetical protein